MISFEQCKHVIEYYCIRMTTDESLPVAPHIHRDCVFLNKMRGELCANISSNAKLKRILELLHKSRHIEQINTVPEGSECFIDKKKIPKSSAGLQLIIYIPDKTRHICLAKKYQNICYSYFKVRHFDAFIEKYIMDWLLTQDWYVKNIYTSDIICARVLNSCVSKAIYTHLVEATDALTNT